MHQSTDTHRAAKNISPEALRQPRSRRQRHANTKRLDKTLLQRAWQTAHRVAMMLYEDFGATQVAVFGSLAEKERFSKWSDIDIAVWGISAEKYLRALTEAENISRLFKIDLIDFESCRERIANQAIRIGKGEIYRVGRRHLIQRISDERAKIGETVKKISEGVYEFLQELLEFRHVFNNICQEEPIYEKTEQIAR